EDEKNPKPMGVKAQSYNYRGKDRTAEHHNSVIIHNHPKKEEGELHSYKNDPGTYS
ncbi:unnamed protein product, partial [marine sediment metagenome]